MAQNLQTFETGTNAKVEIVPLGKGDFAYPKRITITATDPALKNATTVTISASCATSGQTLKLPSGTVLPFLDPVTGTTVIAQLDADASISLSTGSGPYTGTGTLNLVANHLAIADNSTSSNFIPLGSRSTASAGATLADEKLRVFESKLFDVGQIVGASGEFNCEGAFSSLDAGALTVQALTLGAYDIDGTTVIQTAGGYVWVVVTTPPANALYSSGLVIRGIAYCTDFTIELEAGAITKQSLPFALNGEMFYDQPVVA
jgi:hypothetical protein